MYKSPITIMQGKIQTDLEDGILKAVQKVDINVDKEELLTALRFDRDQYDKGYTDGEKETTEKIFKDIIREIDEQIKSSAESYMRAEDDDIFISRSLAYCEIKKVLLQMAMNRGVEIKETI